MSPTTSGRRTTSLTSTDARYDMDTSGFPANPEIWEAVIAVPRFEGSEFTELTLHSVRDADRY